jgi:hypothetical protein
VSESSEMLCQLFTRCKPIANNVSLPFKIKWKDDSFSQPDAMICPAIPWTERAMEHALLWRTKRLRQ